MVEGGSRLWLIAGGSRGHARSSGDVTLGRGGRRAAHSRDLTLITAYLVASEPLMEEMSTMRRDATPFGFGLRPLSPRRRSTAGLPPSCDGSDRREGKERLFFGFPQSTVRSEICFLYHSAVPRGVKF